MTGGFVAGRAGNSQTVNHPTSGRIPNGAIVEKAAPSVTPGDKIHLQLRQSDFTTAARIAAAINKKFGAPESQVARAENSGVVTVLTPSAYKTKPVEFVAELESVSVEADRPAKIVINERTGTIVMGNDVRITPVSILHGALTVEIETQPYRLTAGTSIAGKDRTDARRQSKSQGRQSSRHRAETGSQCRGVGARLGWHRVNAPRHHRHFAESAGGRRD